MTVQTFLLISLTILLGGCGGADSNFENEGASTATTPGSSGMKNDDNGSTEKVEQIEAKIALPEGAYDLNEYDRYYMINGDSFEATYIRSSDGGGSIYFVEARHEIPEMLDGGCQVVHVSGDISVPEEASTFCSGVA